MRQKIFNIRFDKPEKNQKYFNNLLEDIINNKCILMIGSGISKKCFGKDRKNLPNWYQFLESFMNYQYKNKKYSLKEYTEIKNMLKDSNKFQIIAGDLIEKTDIREFREFLENIFSPKDIYPSYLHKLLCLFPFRAIITTNYDNLIEKSYYEIYKRFPKLISYMDIKQGAEISKNFFIAKIHGDIEDPSTIIISQIDYMNLIHNSPNYIEFLSKLFKEYTFLFTGYSFSDPDIQFIIDKLSFNGTYCYLISDNAEVTPIECKRYFKDKKIIVLGFDNTDKSYNQLDDGFDQLLDLVLIKEKKLCSTLYPLIDNRNFVILILYGKNDKEDGLFLHNYFYRNKKILVELDNNDFKYSKIFNSFNEIAPSIDFIVLYIGKAKLNNISSNFLKAIEVIEKLKKKFHYKIIIAATPYQKEIIGEKFPDYPTFFLKENFSDVDILPLFNYTLNLSSYKLTSFSIGSGKSTICAHYKSKFESWDKDSYDLFLKYKDKIKEYRDLLAKKDYTKALEIINELISLSEFKFEKIFLREIIYDKIRCIYKLKKYKECLELFELYKIDCVNDETFRIFNYKAYSLSILGLFEESMKIANNLEINCINLLELQENILLKLKIFENTHKCLERVEFINKCLDELPNELELKSVLKKFLEMCLSCKHYAEQLEKN